MSVTAALFRKDFTEFTDPVAYPNSDVEYYIRIAGLLLNTQRWSTMIDVGTELFVAHHCALERKQRLEAKNGKPPGFKVGVMNSASVDKVSAGYDTQAVIEPGAGHWNMTVYGVRFRDLMNMVGMGGVQIGIGCAPPLSGPAWPGPDCTPGNTGWGN